MAESPSISICIPAYKRIEFLKRLFDSISIQTFKNYEVIVTDDSPDETVEKFIKMYDGIQNLSYYKNKIVLGTPENWNESIKKASGKWIKLMHDDDWFTDENSLETFFNASLKNVGCAFIFSAYNNIDEKTGIKEAIYLNWWSNFLLKQSPLNLFKKQFVGNPSCTLIRRDVGLFYDNQFKWVVDFEYYIRCLVKVKKYHYIKKALLSVGVNDEQVTKYSFRIAEVEIPENHLLIEKLGFHILRNLFVYDYYWRFYRNLEIKNEQQIKKYYYKPVHSFLKQMVSSQKRISPEILNIGLFSKLLMFQNYFLSLFKRLNK